MTEIPAELSPGRSPEEMGVLATGPFVVERTDPGGPTFYTFGFKLTSLSAESVSWLGDTHVHELVPAQEPVSDGTGITFTDPGSGEVLRIRPLAPNDEAIADLGDDVALSNRLEPEQRVAALADRIWSAQFDMPTPIEMGEDNLYLTRDPDGSVLALVKMSASQPTLIRQDKGWRALADDEDELLGASDTPVKEQAVLAWDSGNLDDVERLLMDDRFSPADVINVWFEVGDTEELERLLIARTRGQIYERTHEARWRKATPNEDAPTLDVEWNAVSAWDAGDLRRIAQAQQYDTNGDAA